MLLLLLILASSTDAFADEPFMTLIFLVQIFLIYHVFRTKYAMALPLMWCMSCNERRHLRFHFCNGFFCVFIIFVDVLDIFRSAITKNGLLQNSKGLFVVEIFSLLGAVAIIVCFWRYPSLILSERAARREVDIMERRERNRF